MGAGGRPRRLGLSNVITTWSRVPGLPDNKAGGRSTHYMHNADLGPRAWFWRTWPYPAARGVFASWPPVIREIRLSEAGNDQVCGVTTPMPGAS